MWDETAEGRRHEVGLDPTAAMNGHGSNPVLSHAVVMLMLRGADESGRPPYGQTQRGPHSQAQGTRAARRRRIDQRKSEQCGGVAISGMLASRWSHRPMAKPPAGYGKAAPRVGRGTHTSLTLLDSPPHCSSQKAVSTPSHRTTSIWSWGRATTQPSVSLLQSAHCPSLTSTRRSWRGAPARAGTAHS